MSSTTKDQMKLARQAITCEAPSGFEVTIKPPNIELHALSGGLPARLKSIAEGGVEAVDQALKDAGDGDPELMTYLSGIVARLFVDPVFDAPVYEWVETPPAGGGFGAPTRQIVRSSGDDLDEYLLPADFKWALLVAFGEADEDGTGAPLWGRKPMTRFAPFREEHRGSTDRESGERAQPLVSVGDHDGRPAGAVPLS